MSRQKQKRRQRQLKMKNGAISVTVSGSFAGNVTVEEVDVEVLERIEMRKAALRELFGRRHRLSKVIRSYKGLSARVIKREMMPSDREAEIQRINAAVAEHSAALRDLKSLVTVLS